MPITLGCPSCGKRFRARDESAGKRVKCPFCQAAVAVPTSEEAASANAPTDTVPPLAPGAAGRPSPSSPEFSLPPVDPPTPPPTSRPAAVAAAPASVWGTSEPTPAQPLLLEVDPTPPRERERPWPHRPPPTDEPTHTPAGRGEKGRGKKPRPADAEGVPGWRAARRGLGWVQFGLFWFALIGMVPFGKLVYERAVGDLPDGPGWVKIDGYVNEGQGDIVRTTQREEIDAAAYGLPVLLGGFALVLGRVVAGTAPRASGAKGLFFFSGLFSLFALVGALSVPVCEKAGLRETGEYARTALVVGGLLAEFWFLVGLGNAAGAVRRPSAARAVGRFALVVGLAYLVATVGWEQYVKHGPEFGRPRPLDADWRFFEEAAKMLGWLLVVGSYWRAVSAVKHAIRLHVEDVEDGKA
jgi:hypothetical protein